MSLTLDMGNKIRFAPASNATCMHSAKLRTCTIVPPRLMSPLTASCACTGLLRAAEQRAMKLTKENHRIGVEQGGQPIKQALLAHQCFFIFSFGNAFNHHLVIRLQSVEYWANILQDRRAVAAGIRRCRWAVSCRARRIPPPPDVAACTAASPRWACLPHS